MEDLQTYDFVLNWARTVARGDILCIAFFDIAAPPLQIRVYDRSTPPLRGVVRSAKCIYNTKLEKRYRLCVELTGSNGTCGLWNINLVMYEHFDDRPDWLWKIQKISEPDHVLSFASDELSVLTIRPFTVKAAASATSFIRHGKRRSFAEVLVRSSFIPQRIAWDLAIMMFP